MMVVIPRIKNALYLKVIGLRHKSRAWKIISFSISALILVALSIGVTAYFDIPPGSQIARQFNSEDRVDFLDVVAIADFSGPTAPDLEHSSILRGVIFSSPINKSLYLMVSLTAVFVMSAVI